MQQVVYGSDKFLDKFLATLLVVMDFTESDGTHRTRVGERFKDATEVKEARNTQMRQEGRESKGRGRIRLKFST